MNESLNEITQQKLERRINIEEGNPFRSSSLEQKFQKHNEGITINEDGNNNPNAKRSLGSRQATLGITSCFPPVAAHGTQPSIKAKLPSTKKWMQVDFVCGSVLL